ncbi:helix-turn-helix transcriptional regulator [Pedobacter nutrimenti]|nr:helix-turn-helix transcriptional regulator [Pedobacter nutrimenti]
MSETHKNAKTEYAERLKAFRKMADVSQENLAKAIFVHQPYIASLEAGNISIGLDKMEQIAAYFGVKYYHLADPEYSIPPRQVLRENIEKYIRSTQTESGYLKNESPNFTKSIDQILQGSFLIQPRSAKEIATECNRLYASGISSSRVSDILARSPRKDLVEVLKTAKGRIKRYQLKQV